DDFAQKINFRGDMVCKVELASRFMLAYATASDAYNQNIEGTGERRERRMLNLNLAPAPSIRDTLSTPHSSNIFIVMETVGTSM
ncbi:hypothetical protein PENTCL1PPCAC_8642, partial [Pristionchus entomophagus]